MKYILKSHNVSVLIHDYDNATKFVLQNKELLFFDEDRVDKILKDIGLEIKNHYEIRFLEIGSDKENLHLLNSSYSNTAQ